MTTFHLPLSDLRQIWRTMRLLENSDGQRAQISRDFRQAVWILKGLALERQIKQMQTDMRNALPWLEIFQRQLADEAIADCELWEDRKRRLAMTIGALREHVRVADVVREEDVEALGLPLSADGTCGNVAC